MRGVWIRMAALLLAVILAAGATGVSVRATQTESGEQIRQERKSHAETAVYTVLGLAFLCAGGMVALIMAKDPT